MTLVVDVSVALPWNVTSQATPLSALAAEMVVSQGAVVPFHFHLEYCNALTTVLRRARITTDQFDAALSNIRDLDLSVDAVPIDAIDQTVLPLALRHGLTTYDAAYLELALRTGHALATCDRDLAAAARAAGVVLVGD